MYLVNVQSLQLEAFSEAFIPPYAVLSHRWREYELNLKEVRKNRANVNKQGYLKMMHACKLASYYELKYLWIDTCCIDKDSSAELSEAINSMYRWYEQARICIVYLDDVIGCPNEKRAFPIQFDHTQFTRSEWFSRSWTLQELLAPEKVIFYSSTWHAIGSKSSLKHLISTATDIPLAVLEKRKELCECSIAERMSWAARRRATRTEDIAYSLLGIFDVNIPMLYGEGRKAFVRLQEEIIKQSTDLSIFAWGIDEASPSLLASSPADFSSFTNYANLDLVQHIKPFSMNNLGLDIELECMCWDINTYAVLVARPRTSFADHEIHASSFLLLTLRVDEITDHLHRSCVIKLNDMDNLGRTQWKRVNILRHPRATYQIMRGFEVAFRSSGNVEASATPIERLFLETWEIMDSDVRWKMWQCNFTEFNINNSATMKYNVDGAYQVWIELCLDANFELYVHISEQALPLRIGQYLKPYVDFDVLRVRDWRHVAWKNMSGCQVTALESLTAGTRSWACRTVDRRPARVVTSTLCSSSWHVILQYAAQDSSKTHEDVRAWKIEISKGFDAPRTPTGTRSIDGMPVLLEPYPPGTDQ